MSSEAIAPHYLSSDIMRETRRKGNRVKKERNTKKKTAEGEQREYRKLGELTQHFQILVEGGGALANSTPRVGADQKLTN